MNVDQATGLRGLVKNSGQNLEAFDNAQGKDTQRIRVISVTSGKGGVGKTNVVANLALAFQNMGIRVLILDADLGLGNMDILLGLNPKYTIKGETDSERFFYYLINGSSDQLTSKELKNKLVQLKKFSGANFVLTNGEYSFVANWYSLNPAYYSMKMLNQDDSIMISSEVLPHYCQDVWHLLENFSIVSVRTTDLTVRKEVSAIISNEPN